MCLIWLGQEVPTQEFSETDIIRGAKLEDGILGVVFPLMDGVFSPCAKDTLAPQFGSPFTLADTSVAEREHAYHETASVAH